MVQSRDGGDGTGMVAMDFERHAHVSDRQTCRQIWE